jgi:hypothetical protein
METTAHTADRTSNGEGVSLDLSHLWMLPILLLSVMAAIFADYADKLKEKRRTKPLPKSWKEHWANLRLAEWHIRELTTSGVEQIFSDQNLDLHQLVMDPTRRRISARCQPQPGRCTAASKPSPASTPIPNATSAAQLNASSPATASSIPWAAPILGRHRRYRRWLWWWWW